MRKIDVYKNQDRGEKTFDDILKFNILTIKKPKGKGRNKQGRKHWERR